MHYPTQILMKLSTFSLLLVLTLFSCQKGPLNFEGGQISKVLSNSEFGASAKTESASIQFVSNNNVVERKLIKTGRLEFISNNVEQTRDSIEKLCRHYNAYISDEDQNNYDRRLQFEQTIRIPSGQFDALMKAVEAIGENVESRQITTEDVTEEYIDVEARLKTKKELEHRYIELLKKAKSVSDIVSIEGQIANTRSDIESMQGRLNYLLSQVSYSTLTIVYYENIGTEYGFGSKFFASLKNGWENLLLFVIGLLNIWPFVLIGAALIWGFIRARRLRRKKEGLVEEGVQ
jgi:hypothetical protein